MMKSLFSIVGTLADELHNTKPQTPITFVHKLTFRDTINMRKRVKFRYLSPHNHHSLSSRIEHRVSCTSTMRLRKAKLFLTGDFYIVTNVYMDRPLMRKNVLSWFY